MLPPLLLCKLNFMGCFNYIKSLFSGTFHSSSNSDQKPTQKSLESKPTIIPPSYSTLTGNMALPKTYKQAAFKETGGPLVVEEVSLKLPTAGEILVKVEACGVCHSEIFAQYNVWGAGFPVVPGHEIIGKVAALGDGVQGWNVGDRIGGAWHGGHDGSCDKCKRGLYQFCEPFVVNGVTKDGGCKSLPSLPLITIP